MRDVTRDRLCRGGDLLHWLGPTVWRVDLAPDAVVIEQTDKLVTSGPVRLVEPSPRDAATARLFAVECAVDALTRAGVTDARSWTACEVAFRYAVGDATDTERAAAWAAAGDAPRAARCASAYASAWPAASGTALGVALDAVRAQQTRRVLWWTGVRDA